MRKTFLIFAFLNCFFCSCLIADEGSSQSLWDYHPLHLGGNLIRIGKASVDADEGGHLYFRKSNIFLNMLLPISAKSYFFPRIEWNSFTLDWNKNPKFRETHFYYAQFGLMFYTTAIDLWRWIARVEYGIDLEHFAHFSTYGLFSGMLWGAYELYESVHFHVGALMYVGLEEDWPVYPIIGFDYSPSNHWTFEAIFPVSYSIQYKFNKNWRLSTKARPLKERFRAASKEIQPCSIFNYTTIGAEINLHYERFMRFECEIYAGYNFGGDFYIKNKTGHSPLYTDVKGAPYIGANLDYAF